MQGVTIWIEVEWKSANCSGTSPARTVPNPFSTARTVRAAPGTPPLGLTTGAPTKAGVMNTLYGPGSHSALTGHEISVFVLVEASVTSTRKFVSGPVAIKTVPVAWTALQA